MGENHFKLIHELHTVLNKLKGFETGYSSEQSDKLFINNNGTLYKLTVEKISENIESEQLVNFINAEDKRTPFLQSLEKKPELDRIHDCFYDVFGVVPEPITVKLISENIPKHIRKLADTWGWDDTEVRDFTCEWIKENVNKAQIWE